ERCYVLMKLARRAARQFADRDAFLLRPSVDLVVDVGDVAHIGDMPGAIEMAEQPEQHVEDDDRPRIADMGIVIDGRPADIHAHCLGIDRREDVLRSRESIVEFQRGHKLLWDLPARRIASIEIEEKRPPASVYALDANNNAAHMNGIFPGGRHGPAKWPNCRLPSSPERNPYLSKVDMLFRPYPPQFGPPMVTEAGGNRACRSSR